MSLSESCFYKWRCLIALARVDARIDPSERQFFSNELNQLENEDISREQMMVLADDLKNPKQPEVFFFRVEDPIEKVDLLRMAYFLFVADDNFEIREQKVYEHLKKEIARSLDISEVMLDNVAKMPHKSSKSSIKSLIPQIFEIHKVNAVPSPSSTEDET